MTFQDVFKSSFLENVSAISILDMGLALLLAFGLGLFIFFVYKKTYAGVMYSSSFGVTLVALTMITTLVISRNRWTSHSCSGRSPRALCWRRG